MSKIEKEVLLANNVNRELENKINDIVLNFTTKESFDVVINKMHFLTSQLLAKRKRISK